MTNDWHRPLPRNLELPPFDPHAPAFDCKIEADEVPPVDAQARAWLLEARALESPEIYYKHRDYDRIVKLTQHAAARRHWQAMLNLASFYLEGRDPDHGTEDAVRLVENAMRLGIPAAYARMGTYYKNGTGVHADATKAYAFWQKAAQMGNPEAMTHLAEQMVSIKDEPERGMWSNIPIAIKMFECALSQGHGPAAYELSFEYRFPSGRKINNEDRAKIINVIHQGVRLGCANCAARLWIEFDHPDLPEEMMVPRLDRDRAKRYYVLADYLDFNPDLRFPNLDQIIPLPPAPLPPWNGDKEALIQAATGESPLPDARQSPSPTNSSNRKVTP